MIRTLWVTNDLPPRAGGIEQFLGNLLALRDPSATRVLASRWPGDAAHDAGLAYRVERVGRRPLLPTPRLAARVRRAAADHDADVVVLGALWPLGELGGRLGRPVFALTHGHEAGMARVRLGPLVRRAARGVDALGVISGFTRDQLAAWTAGRPMHHVPPGVDTTVFTPEADGAAARDRHGLPADQPLVVCIARLVRRKGQDVLLEAWPAVRERVPGAHLLLGGTGPLDAHLRTRVRALGLERCVTLAGEIASADLPGYHSAADVFAMPCRTRLGGLDVEGLGIVYLEAQACGTPVVAGRSGGAPEALVDGQTGVVVDGRSPAAVARAVADLLADPQRRQEMGRSGRAFVRGRYTWPVIGARLDGVLAELTGMM